MVINELIKAVPVLIKNKHMDNRNAENEIK